MAQSDFAAVPYRVLLLQAAAFLAELEADENREIIGPLEREGYDVKGLIRRFRELTEGVSEGRSVQLLDLASLGDLGEEVSKEADRGARFVRSLARRVKVHRNKALASVRSLTRLLDGHGLPAKGASVVDVFERLGAINRWFKKYASEELPGLGALKSVEARNLTTSLLRAFTSEEGQETAVEAATNELQDARLDLQEVCELYLDMLDVVNGELEDDDKRPIPGGDQEVVVQWVATRPAVVAGRVGEIVPLGG